MASEEVIRCFQGELQIRSRTRALSKLRVPVKESEAETAQGVLLASISTDSIQVRRGALKGNAAVFFLVYGMLVTALAVLLSICWCVRWSGSRQGSMRFPAAIHKR